MKPLVQQSQINKCPHGFVVGTCPICSGKGSMASSDRNKPRKKGEMSYNECLAQWNRIKALKQSRLNEQKQLNFQKFNQDFKKNTFLKNILQNVTKLMDFKGFKNSLISKSFNFVLNNSANIFKGVFNKFSQMFKSLNLFQNSIQNFFASAFQKSSQFLNSIIEKLSSFLGQEKNFKDEKQEKTRKRQTGMIKSRKIKDDFGK